VTLAHRSTALATVLTIVVVLSSCDTGDGKQLQPFDPADYPQAAPTTLDAAVDTAFDTAFDAGLDAGTVLGGDDNASASLPEPAGAGAFSLIGPWGPGETIDPRHTCDGENVAPALSWGGVPDGTVEIAIAMFDDSAVSDGQPFVHWVIGGLDPGEIALGEADVPDGAVQALNFFGDVGYGGPCPSPGAAPHLYRLTAYALNTRLERADGTLATEFLDAIAIATLRSTDLSGFYQR
jgi:Raf kinase inhibitor-like YbhB/YbcL family protein